MRIRNKHVFILGLTALFISGMFYSTEACCVYNHTTTDLDVDLRTHAKINSHFSLD